MEWSKLVTLAGVVCAGAWVASGCAVGALIDDSDSGVPTTDGGGNNTDGGGCSAMCSGQCADLKTDNANCGKCGNACPSGATCVQGNCQCQATSTKCGATCVDLKTDNANCGKCGTVCGNDAGAIMGGGTWTCQNGACGISCPMGKTQCAGACVDTKTDNDNCGMCGTACMAMTEACTDGLCCATGQSNCGGMCTDVQYDAKNCGKCGTACPMNTPYCSKGMCTTCDNSVLILSDSNATGNNAFLAKVNGAGLNGTLVSNGVATYANSPVATNFAVVMVMVGDGYSTDMPAAGQQAIVNAQAAGKGVVITDWGGYHVYSSRWATLKAVNLYTYTTGATGTFGLKLEQANHPIWTGLPQSFTTTSSMGYSTGTIVNSGVRIAGNSTTSGAGVVVRTSPGGRIVYVNHAANYTANSAWVSDTNTVNLTINAIKWATGCLL